MAEKKILLLEDDPNLGFMLQENLELRGYEVKLCTNGDDGMKAYTAERFDLCLVDVMMPKKDGFTFAREVRERDQQTPLIFLTAKSLKEDRIEGLKIGADDYITKPFSMEELALRIQAVLKRSVAPSHHSHDGTTFTIGNYVFDYERQTLQIKNKKQKLTAKEAELLKLFCLHLNATLERELALKEIWGDDSYFNGRSMDVFISRLRSYLKSDSRIEILNVHGKGFKLVVTE
ncbi:MAG: response regulator transcription factor [Ignavibacteriae bacterium]|nr:response regulator transcription factor [Ignavibacteriota bacterium]